MHFYKIISFAVILTISLCLSSCSNNDNHIVSFMHANINCSDLEQSRTFYEMLGFTAVMEGDSEVSAEFAAALNMPPYTLAFTQMLSRDGSLIDLIEWKEPYDNSTAYPSANHLGIARLTLQTPDLDMDVTVLEAEGIELFSEPVTMTGSSGTRRFVCFKDPDGTIIELVETAQSGDNKDFDVNITGFLSVNINCSNYERSRIFYEHLGYSLVSEIADNGTLETAAAYDLPAYQVRGSLMQLKNSGPSLNLLEWKNPFDNSPPYTKLNHLGIPRIALKSKNLDADVARLKAEGIEFYTDPVVPEGPLAFLRVVFLEDPDGTVIELVELFPGLMR